MPSVSSAMIITRLDGTDGSHRDITGIWNWQRSMEKNVASSLELPCKAAGWIPVIM